ncbi:MAG: class I SAM-dependent methyltransferase [Armatimonadetes bacterium]|nr:class I SAM-dependent methyltransferase [Armatimonadota bacterium]
MFFELANYLMDHSPLLRRRMNHLFYQVIARLDEEGSMKVMNYGFVPSGGPPLRLDPEDEQYRPYLQLYHHIATAAGVQGRDVLEVGSGKGGGASWVHRHLTPRTTTGVDYAKTAVAFCRATYPLEGLEFRVGDAEDLPFEAESFDVVLNIESSHCYASMPRFFAEVHRVLRPAGRFTWTDYRPPAEVDGVVAQLREAGFEIREQQIITPNVHASLDALSDTNRKLIDQQAPWFIRSLMYEFAAVEGTVFYRHFERRTLEYVVVVAEKEGPPATR